MKEAPNVIASEAQPRLGKAKQFTPDRGFSLLKIATAGGAALGLTVAADRADAQDTTPMCPDGAYTQVLRTQLIPNTLRGKLKRIFSGTTPDGTDLFSDEWDLDSNSDGSVTATKKGPTLKYPQSGSNASDLIGIEFQHGDGTSDFVQYPGIDEISGREGELFDLNGRPMWPDVGEGCFGDTRHIHPAESPNTVAITVDMDSAGGDINTNVRRVNIHEPDWCAAALASPKNPRESTSYEELRFATGRTDDGTNALAAKTADDGAGLITNLFCNRAPGNVPINPGTGLPENPLKHLDMDADGNLVLEPEPQTTGGRWEREFSDSHLASSVAKVHLTDGRILHIYGFDDDTDPTACADGGPYTPIAAWEETPPDSCQFTKVPIVLATPDPTPPDDDGDGLSNAEEECDLLAEPSAADLDADGVADACQPKCETAGHFGLPAEGATVNASGLAVCEDSGKPELPVGVRMPDGSRLFSNQEITLTPEGSVAVNSGQTIEYIGVQHPLGAEHGSQTFQLPLGSSADITLVNLQHPDGTPGEATVTHIPIDDPFAAPVVQTFTQTDIEANPDGIFIHLDPGAGTRQQGDEMSVSGSVLRTTAGSESMPMPACPPTQPPGGWAADCPCPPQPLEVCDPPGDDDVEPTDDDVEPTDDDVEPTDDDVEPTDDDVEPTDDDVTPTDDDVTPTDDDVEPTDDDVEPTDDDVEPTDDDTGIPPKGECPAKCDDLSFGDDDGTTGDDTAEDPPADDDNDDTAVDDDTGEQPADDDETEQPGDDDTAQEPEDCTTCPPDKPIIKERPCGCGASGAHSHNPTELLALFGAGLLARAGMRRKRDVKTVVTS